MMPRFRAIPTYLRVGMILTATVGVLCMLSGIYFAYYTITLFPNINYFYTSFVALGLLAFGGVLLFNFINYIEELITLAFTDGVTLGLNNLMGIDHDQE